MDWSGYLSQQGRGNDTLVAHISPEEAMLLKRRGGSGTRNPKTGLLEFFSGDEGDVGTGTDDRGGLGDDPAAGNYGGWGGGMATGMPGDDPAAYSTWGDLGLGFDNLGASWSSWGMQKGHTAPQGITGTIGFNPTNISLMDVVKTIGKVGIAGLALASGVPAMSVLGPMFSSAVTGMMAKEAKSGFGFKGMDAEQQSAAIANNKTEAPVSENPTGGWDIETSPLGGQITENEKRLDQLFKKFGEVGDFQGALTAAKTFETKAGIKATLESEIIRYSKDPLYEAIEPEFRSVADAMQETGMEPKVAAEYAFAKVKEAYNARKYIREYLDRKRKELEDGDIENVAWKDKVITSKNKGYDPDITKYSKDPRVGMNTQIREFTPAQTNDLSDMDASDIAAYRERVRRQGIKL